MTHFIIGQLQAYCQFNPFPLMYSRYSGIMLKIMGLNIGIAIYVLQLKMVYKLLTCKVALVLY